MQIIPGMHLQDGRCVSEYKGEAKNTTILSVNPLKSANEFESQGALSVFIFDGDTEGNTNKLIAESIAKNTSLQVIYAGRVSTMGDIDDLFIRGIARLVLSDKSIQILPEALSKFGVEKIWYLIRGERNLVPGKVKKDVVEYGKKISDLGVKKIIYWDTKTEGTFHPNFDEIEKLILSTGIDVIPFGGIGSMSDIEVFKNTGAAGVILSRALFERKVYLRNCYKKFEDR